MQRWASLEELPRINNPPASRCLVQVIRCVMEELCQGSARRCCHIAHGSWPWQWGRASLQPCPSHPAAVLSGLETLLKWGVVGHGLIVSWAGAGPQLEENVWVLCRCLKLNTAGQNCRSVSTKQEGDGHTGQQSISTFLFF